MPPRSTLMQIALAAALLPTPLPAAAPPDYVPALDDFPDPFVLRTDGRYLAYATNPARGHVNVQMATSADLLHWVRLRDGDRPHDALPVLPPWAKRGYTWAPEVLQTAAGYVLYFTARDRRSHLQCIGAATARNPAGPFTSTAAAPLVCQADQGGSIDPDPLRDADGKLFLYYKNDGNNPRFRQPTRIFAQRLTPDGLRVVGTPVPLLANTAKWEGKVIEAPTMIRRGRGYFLFFSANDYGWHAPRQRLSAYAIGYASCSSAMGPCLGAPENPILGSRSGAGYCLSGPGHQAVFRAGAQDYIAFHAWSAGPGCRFGRPERSMYVARLNWPGGKPVIGTGLQAPVPLAR